MVCSYRVFHVIWEPPFCCHFIQGYTLVLGSYGPNGPPCTSPQKVNPTSMGSGVGRNSSSTRSPRPVSVDMLNCSGRFCARSSSLAPVSLETDGIQLIVRINQGINWLKSWFESDFLTHLPQNKSKNPWNFMTKLESSQVMIRPRTGNCRFRIWLHKSSLLNWLLKLSK